MPDVRPMSTGVVPEIRALQRECGPGVCCVCLNPITRKVTQGRARFFCRDLDCRREEDQMRRRYRLELKRGALLALRNVVAAVGWSTETLVRLVGP